MKEKEKIIVGHWKKVLENYLDPLALIGQLPSLFQYGHHAHENVYSQRHIRNEAVHCAIMTIMDSDLTLDNLIDAIRGSGNEWLATLVKGDVPDSDIEAETGRTNELEKTRRFLSLLGPHIKKTIQAVEVANRFRFMDVISREEFEQVESTAKMEGNSLAVDRLMSHLVRKSTEWLPKFVEILGKCNYDATLTHSLQEFIDVSSSSVTNGEHTERAIVKEGEQPDMKATPPRSGARNAANFLCTVPQSPSNDNQTYESCDDKSSPLLLEAKGKNVIIFVPKGCTEERVIAQVIIDQTNDTFLTEPKVVVIVDQPERVTAMETLLKSYVGVGLPVASVSEINKVPLREVFKENTVITMTVQGLERFLNDGSITVYDLNLMIFDNCWSTCDDNHKNVLSHIISKENHDSLLQVPQVVGILTAVNEYVAVDKVWDVCARMNAMGGIVSVTDESKSAEHSTMSDPFTMCLCDTINKQMGILAKIDSANNKTTGTISFSDQVIGNEKNKTTPAVILQDVTRLSSDMQACIDLLQIFNKALDIHVKMSPYDAVNYLRQKHQNWSLSSTKESELGSIVESELVELANAAYERLTECASENWNWIKVLNEIKSTFKKDLNSRIMLIVEKEQHVQQIKNELSRDEALTKMKILPESLLVNAHSTDEKSAHKLLIANLQNRVTKILVCTPEGASCGVLNGIEWNLTICYDSTKGMLSKNKIDRRELQKYCNKESCMTGGSSKSLLEAIAEVQDIFNKRWDDYKSKISVRQSMMLPSKTASNVNWHALPPRPSLSPPSSYEVQCLNCKTYICNGDDIVKLLTNHTCIDKRVMDKVERREYDDGGTENKEGLHCRKCKVKLGIFAKFKYVYLPQLHPVALWFKYIGPHRYNDITAKKWAKLKINFKEVEENLVTAVWSDLPRGAY